MYIHQNNNWPRFIWDKTKIAELLLSVHHLQGRLLGRMELIGFNIQEETVLQILTQDVVKSSEIEGEMLDPSLVRSSVARHLGLEVSGVDIKDRSIDGIVEMLLDATQNFDQQLTKKRLLQWHKQLFPYGRSGFSKIEVGNWRKKPVAVVSGQMGNEIIHFEGPHADDVNCEMMTLIKWIERDQGIDFILKAAIAHLWFVTIHPFDDGNGRIGRAIADFLLARSEKSSKRFYSLSKQIQKERKGYYQILEQTQKGGLEITPWVVWFIECVRNAMNVSLATLDKAIARGRLWEQMPPVNERQRKILKLLMGNFEGKLTTSKWAKICKCSQDTAYRDIVELMDQQILVKDPKGGRSTSYSLNG